MAFSPTPHDSFAMLLEEFKKTAGNTTSAVTAIPNYSRFVVPIYTATLFLSAALLFSIQPMLGKMVLPILGGTPSVWNTCMVFFQASLLLGYMYAHLSTRWFAARHQAVAHVALLILPLLALPVALRGTITAMATGSPALFLFEMLFFAAGLPFLAVATSAPLLQKWFAQTGHPSAKDPYFLYAASNAGSLLALIAYPFLLEPVWTLNQQAAMWRDGYIALLVLIVICAFLLRRSGLPTPEASTPIDEVEVVGTVTLTRRLSWLLYAFIPSSLMLGVTTYITTDIAAFPLLWIIPLALYLLTFILVFAKRQWLRIEWVGRGLAVLAVPAIIALVVEANYPHFVLVPEHLLVFFGCAMVCHGALAQSRPAPKHLTEYYLWMSLGGVLGGVFNTLIAPVVFSRILEYPAVIILACLFRPAKDNTESPAHRRGDFVFPAVLALLTATLAFLTHRSGLHAGQLGVLATFGVPALLVLSFADRPIRYALGLAAIFIGGTGYVGPLGQRLAIERNFFGVVRVTDDPIGGRRLLVHGNTVHGSESLDRDYRGVPLSYFHKEGPAGDIFAAYRAKRSKSAVGVIGLGAGSLASYASPGESWTFYEINPAVVRFAQGRDYFSFLTGSQAAQLHIVPGDARLSLEDAGEGEYGILVLDAFSSDAIPLHLVTREALELYFLKVSGRGMIAFHITNRYLHLEPVFGNIAAELGVAARTRSDFDVPSDNRHGREASQWLIMARSESDLGPILTNANWRRVQTSNARVWTDDFSNIAGIMRR